MSATVGLRLRQQREEKRLTIEQASKATRIRPHYLQAMEAGDFKSIPSQAQAKGFLRAYADYLGLHADALIAELEGRTPPPSAASRPPVEPAPAEEAVSAPQTPADDTPAPERSSASLMPPADIPPLSAGAGDLPAQEREAASPPPAPRRATPRPPTIFQEIGQTLRRQREVLGLSLEDVERHTHLRQHYLQALENGDLSGLPSPVQGRGMLNNYAIFLGMNPEALLLRFAEGLQARHSATQSSAIEQRPKKARRKSILPRAVRRALSPDLLIGLGLVFFLIVFVGWITIRIFSPANTAQTTATAPSIADVLLATATPTITPTYAPATDTPQPQPTMPPLPTQAIATDPATGATLPPPPATAGVEITVSIRQRSWMRVIVDGKVEFEGRVIAGGAYNFAGAESIEVLTSNGAGMQLVYNGVDMGVLGTYGQIIDRIFTPQGIAEPTPTITPTPGEATAAPSTAIPAGTQPAEASATPAP